MRGVGWLTKGDMLYKINFKRGDVSFSLYRQHTREERMRYMPKRHSANNVSFKTS